MPEDEALSKFLLIDRLASGAIMAYDTTTLAQEYPSNPNPFSLLRACRVSAAFGSWSTSIWEEMLLHSLSTVRSKKRVDYGWQLWGTACLQNLHFSFS